MPRVDKGYEKKSAHLGLRLTEANRVLVDDAVEASECKTAQEALEPLIIKWAKRVLRNKGDK